jgi:hypothetical protein
MQRIASRALTVAEAAKRIEQLLAQGDEEPQVTPAPVTPVTPAPIGAAPGTKPKRYPEGWEHAPGIMPLVPRPVFAPPGYSPRLRFNPATAKYDVIPYETYLPTPVINPDAIPGAQFPMPMIKPSRPDRSIPSGEFIPLSYSRSAADEMWRQLMERTARYRVSTPSL